ncbi:MAG: UvrD-helicase domain-containing protein [Treponemataceae bacterium]|nr:MAG: UvrD-helicase domain-containing protein [Treponemataceae bacterium]
MDINSHLELLNAEQLEACVHFPDSGENGEAGAATAGHGGASLLILAGAGSGKTRVITTKIAYLIAEKHISPYSILAVTFTKKAANEMSERARAIDSRAAGAQIRTFHSFGAYLLRIYWREAALAQNFTVYDDNDSASVLLHAVSGLDRKSANAWAHKIALAKDYCLLPDSADLAQIDASDEFALIYEAYQKKLEQSANADFGDLIMRCVTLLQNNAEIKAHIQNRFKVILVDEYQDSNIAQFMLLREITGERSYICAVGDDDQSIYKFRGAEVQNILSFNTQFANAKIVRLEQNYRSYEPILQVASDVVSKNSGRLGKTLRATRIGGKKPQLIFLSNQDDESRFCAELILKSVRAGETTFTDWAIIYRTNAQSLNFESEFLRQKLPYRIIGSLKFYEREEIKDALSLLAFLANPRNEIAFRRIVNKPARAIGEVSQDKILALLGDIDASGDEAATENSDITGCIKTAIAKKMLSTKAHNGLVSFSAAIETLKEMLPEEIQSEETLSEDAQKMSPNSSARSLALVVKNAIELCGILAYHSESDSEEGTQRAGNLQELVNSAVLYPLSRAGLTEFLDHIELDRTLASAEDEEKPDAVSLITLHNTKGLEFAQVIIAGLEYGIFPRKEKEGADLEEERRLFYVGITRAKDALYMTCCSSRRYYGRIEAMSPCPFLYEIERELLDVRGEIPWGFGGYAQQNLGAGNRALGEMQAAHPLAREWSKGLRIFHDEYGYGAISHTHAAGQEFVITILFENGLEKKFMPQYQAKQLLRIRE